MARSRPQGAPTASRTRGDEGPAAMLAPRLTASLFLLAAVAALVLWSTALREVVIDRDEAVYAVVAREWARGSLPYRDIFDHKPPMIYAVYRGVFAVLGESLAAVRAVFALLTALTGVGAAMIVRVLVPSAPPFMLGAAVLAAVYAQGSAAAQGATANCEPLMMLFVTAAALGALHYRRARDWRWLALYGAAGALALLSKPVCALELALFLVVALTGRGDRKPNARALATGLAAAAVGAAVPLVAVVLYFAVHGGLGEAVAAVIGYNVRYAAGAPVPLAPVLAYFARWGGLGFALFLAGLVVLLWAGARGRERFSAVFLALWSAAAAIGALSAGRPYLHYLGQLGVPLATAAAVAVAALEQAAPARRRRLRAAWLVIAAVLLVPSLRDTAEQFADYSKIWNWQDDLGKLLTARLAPADTLLVWGASPEVYWFTDRRPATRFILKYYVLDDSPFAEKARRELYERTLATPPGAIIVVRDDPSTEDARASDEEWRSYWAPAFDSLLRGYAVTETRFCLIYLRR